MKNIIYPNYEKSTLNIMATLLNYYDVASSYQSLSVIKEVLAAMNIKIVEKADYEGDDILGTFAKKFAKESKDVYILSGDRDLFQLIEDNITVRIPRTKMGKTETIAVSRR